MATPSQSAVAAADSFSIARELLLEGVGPRARGARSCAGDGDVVRKLDYVDLYLQLTRYETWTVEDGIVKEGAYSIDQGIGVRAISGERTGFAYSDQLDEAALLDAVGAARGIARTQGVGSQKIAARPTSHRPLYPSGDPLAQHERQRQGRVARGSRPASARHGQPRRAGHRQPRGRLRGRARASDGRHARGRRAAARAPQRLGHHGEGRPPRAGLCGRRRPRRLQRC